MRNLIILFYLTIQLNQLQAQNRYVNWFFASGAGIKFGTSGPSVQSGGQTNTEEGVATMSDPCGNLLFYSDGTTIWNKKHAVMNNGSGLNGHNQSAEAVLIVPKPASDSLYYVFTTYSYGGSNGMQYNIVDMSKQSGDGQVVTKNVKLYGKSSEKLAAVLHQNQSDYWILSHDWDSAKYKVFLLTDAGLNTSPVITVLGPTTKTSVENALGHLRPSPDGKKVATTFWYQGRLDIYDFNNSNGKLSLDTILTNFAHTRPYSVEFSPNNKILYVGEAATSGNNDIYQYDMTAGNIGASRYTVTTASGYRIGNFNLGADGKFYVSRFDQNYLGVISNPDTYGSGVNFTANGFSLGSQKSKLGLPNQIYPLFITSPTYNVYAKIGCSISTPVKFELATNYCYDSLIWNFADTGKNNISRIRKPTHTYSKKGKYDVTMTVYYKGKSYKITKKIKVPITPDVNLGRDTIICGSINLTLIGADTALTYLWNDNSTNRTKKITSIGKYWVKSTLDGCSGYDTISVSNSTLSTGFTIKDTIIKCFNYNSFTFTNTTTLKFDTLKTCLWKFSDNTTYSDTVLKKSFGKADSFNVKLVVTSKYGCRDSLSKYVIVHPNTTIGFSVNKTPQCFNGHDFILTNNSTVSKGSISKYFWKLGEGDTAITKDISSKKYKKDSTYNVALITTTDKGCKDTISKTVVINPNPKAVYSINFPTQCFTFNSYDFTNSSSIRTGNISKNIWDFGDGRTDTTKTITAKKYTSADSFNVQLLTISDKGCRDSISKKVYVDPNTSIGFGINKTPQCFNGHDFVYTNSSTLSKGTLTYAWTFGDGTTSTNKDISTKQYSLDSTYKITLVTTTDKGCKDTISKSITIHPSPKADFGINQKIQCFKWNLYDYTNSSTIRTGNISNNIWNLGDADTRNTKDIKGKHYITEDSFKVDLLTLSNYGCRDSTAKWIYIQNTPKPGFTINQDTQCFNEHAFDFTNTTKIAAGSFATLWQLGDATTNSNQDVAQKKYSVYGNYKVLQITTSNNNCRDSLQKSIRIHASPDNKFTIDKDRQCFRGNVFNYTNQSTIAEGTITYNWSLGDASTFTTKDVLNHKYSTEDTFNVRLISTSEKNCKDTLTKMAVTFAQPSAKFVVPEDSQCWQKHFFIINNNTTLKYGTMSHIWDFGDGTKDFTHTPQTKRYANKSADYVLKYKVTSDHGCTDSAQKKVSLLERPISVFTINDSIQCFKTNNFSFTNKTTFSDLTTITYFWDYGDGSKTTGKNPKSLSYPTANYYTVQLIASSYLNNCVDTLDKIIVVAPHATPDYTIDNDSQCLRTNKFTFTNLSKVKFGTLKYNWNFGDNTKDTATNPVKKYNNGSNYSVKLVAITNYDCKDSVSKPIVIIPHPKSNYTVNDSTLCKVQSLNITNKTSVLYGTFNQVWHFDEGMDETGLNVNGKKLITSGFHPVRLAVVSNFGCTDTITKKVFVEQSGTTKISIIENDSQCLRGNKTQFNVFSQGGIINLSSYIWQFGDGNSATTQNPTHTYTKDSSFKVSAETVSSNGCLDTAYFDIVIHPHPVTDFTANSPCFPNPVVFNNLSKIKSGTIKSQLWDFDNMGITAALPNPVMVYSSAGTYNIKLKNYSIYGCTDSLTKQIVVKTKPTAMFSYTQIPSPDEIKLQLNNESSADVVTNNWDMGDGALSQEINPIATYKDSGRFTVTLEVINDVGCTDIFRVKTGLFYPDFVFYLPTVFSPNGNGVNDIFKPDGSQYNRKYTMEIFNRWGERVFETHDVTKGWDGKFMDVECPDGIYHCYVRILPMKGPLKSYYTGITLLR